MYYYVVVEYVNNDSQDQSSGEVGQSLSGNISIEIAPNDDDPIRDTDSQKLTTKNVEP